MVGQRVTESGQGREGIPTPWLHPPPPQLVLGLGPSPSHLPSLPTGATEALGQGAAASTEGRFGPGPGSSPRHGTPLSASQASLLIPADSEAAQGCPGLSPLPRIATWEVTPVVWNWNILGPDVMPLAVLSIPSL